MKLAWITDVHLNFVKPDYRQLFYSTLKAAQPDGLLLGGDIAEAPTLLQFLHEMDSALNLPLYFVLGNHDFYHSSIEDVRTRIREIEMPRLHWLTDSSVQWLTEKTALIGDDGWADG